MKRTWLTGTRQHNESSLGLFLAATFVILVGLFLFLPTTQKTWFADLILTPGSVIVMLSFMVLWASWVLIDFGRKVGAAERDLKRLEVEVAQPATEDSTDIIEKLREGEEKFGSLDENFKSYLYQLVEVANTGHDKSYRTTLPAAYVIDYEHVLNNRINLTILRAMPNYLTGVGILFTFVGLAAGIHLGSSGFQTQDMTELRQALSRLLSGASLAFLTSIAGLILSIFISRIVKRRLYRFGDQIKSFSNELDMRYPFVSQVQLSQAQLEEAREQTGQLKTFNTDMAVSIAGALDKALAPRFEALGSSISGTLKEASEREAEGLEKITQAVEAIRTDQGESLVGMMEQLIARFQESLNGAAGAQFQAMGETLQHMTATINRSQDEMRRAQEEMAGVVKALGTQAMDALHAGSRTMLASVEDALQKMAELIKESSSTACKEFEESQSRATAGLENAIAKLAGTGEGVDRILDKVSEVTGKISEDCVKRTRDTVKGVGELLTDQARTLQNGAQEALKDMNNQMLESTKMVTDQLNISVHSASGRLSALLDRFTMGVLSLDQWLGKQQSFQAKTEEFLSNATGLASELEKMSVQLKQIANPLSITTGMLHRTATDAKQGAELTNKALVSIKDLAVTLDRQQETLSKSWEQYQLRFQGLDESLASLFQQIEEGVSDFAAQLTDHVGKIDEHTAGIAGHLNSAASALDERTEEFVEAVEKLAGVFRQIRK